MFKKILTFSKPKISDSSKLKEFADGNFKFDEKERKVLKTDRKHLRNRRNCSLRAISPFPEVFSKDLYCRHVKNQGLFEKGLRAK